MKRVGQSHSEFLVPFNFKLILFSYFNGYFWGVNFIHFRSFRIHSADFLRTYFFFSLPVCSFFVLSLSSANHGHLTKVTSAWLTCKLHGCNLFKTSASLRTIKANLKFRKWTWGAFSCSLLLLDAGESILSFLSVRRRGNCIVKSKLVSSQEDVLWLS